MLGPRLSLCLSLVALHHSTCNAARQVVPFRYGWRFRSGPGPDDGPGPGTCAFERDLSGQSCTGMEYNPHEYSAEDCRIACCYEPSCLVWQADYRDRPLCRWGGTNVTCTPGGKDAYESGGSRQHFQPIKEQYAFSASDLDDSTWARVDIPHDSLINGTFTNSTDIHRGFLPRNVSWYRKRFTLPRAAANMTWRLDFEGAFHYTQVWLNGNHVLDHSIGYTPFSVPLANLSFGEAVVIAVRTDASYGVHSPGELTGGGID